MREDLQLMSRLLPRHLATQSELETRQGPHRNAVHVPGVEGGVNEHLLRIHSGERIRVISVDRVEWPIHLIGGAVYR
jgi:hypothetical protein